MALSGPGVMQENNTVIHTQVLASEGEVGSCSLRDWAFFLGSNEMNIL